VRETHESGNAYIWMVERKRVEREIPGHQRSWAVERLSDDLRTNKDPPGAKREYHSTFLASTVLRGHKGSQDSSF
jgi:hypothetical protein